MMDLPSRLCRMCGGPISPTTNTRGGRPREHCHTCRPSQAAARRRQRDHEQLIAPCRRCGREIQRTSITIGRRKRLCDACSPVQHGRAEVALTDLLAAPETTELQRSVFASAADLAEAGGWTPKGVGTLLHGLRQVFDVANSDQLVCLSTVKTTFPGPGMAKLAAAVLDEHQVLTDDTVPSIVGWIDRKCAELPVGFREEVRAWLLELHTGGERTRPRSRSTLYAYFGRARPHLIVWSRTYEHLREITEQDVLDVLNSLRGHQRAGTFTSLRSLFQFARRHRLLFTDPTRRLHVGQAPKRSVLPMTDEEIATVRRAAVTLTQRLVVALVAVYAARAAAIRHLTLDDVELARRRIRIAGTIQPMPDLVHQLLRAHLTERQRLWPHTPNRHILLSRASAAGIDPVSDYYLSWHLSMQDVPLEHLRADRVLHEAVAVDADPLHLAQAFNLCTQTAIDYSEIARNLAARPVEDQQTGASG